MYFVIDRIEGETAVCAGDDGDVFNIPLKYFPEDVREGAAAFISLDENEKKKRTDRISALMERFEKKQR